jgi:glycosyltransferase involved in cell wall biosynthesis
MVFAKQQARALQRRGIEVDAFFLPVWSNFPNLLRSYHQLLRKVTSSGYDIVHAQYGTMTGILCTFASPNRFVVTFRGSDLNPASNKSHFRNSLGLLLSQLAALHADSVLCVSSQLKARLWWKKRKAEILPSAVDLEMFAPMPRIPTRQSLGWDLNKRYVLFNGGRSPTSKGLPIVERAIHLAETRTGPIELVLLNGSTPTHQMPLYYNSADCLIFASLFEGSPNVVKEAMACNLPVVSTEVGDVRERLQGVYPSAVTPCDPRCLADALGYVLLIGGRSNGRERIASLSLESATERLIQIYTSILARPHS